MNELIILLCGLTLNQRGSPLASSPRAFDGAPHRLLIALQDDAPQGGEDLHVLPQEQPPHQLLIRGRGPPLCCFVGSFYLQFRFIMMLHISGSELDPWMGQAPAWGPDPGGGEVGAA